ncbi:hypothetical protein V6Z12_A12G098700 [Gossypium hirsutum]|uniref:alpha-1,2-Mannosidase n=1 Tax=Gossypium hirsutum TaxID=3635 RepID=A0ABM2ZBT9_GOSHI|nr:mannosyl-oligosaccharide 1,2-alpha-mannosidase MNS1-like [Gossypium hirsutum]
MFVKHLIVAHALLLTIARMLYPGHLNNSVLWVANTLDFNKTYDASVFETTIRVVGGLLSTYDLSGDNIFLEKARDIADRLLPAWDTPSGIPYNIINLARGNAHNPGWTGGDSILADSGTEQLEFIALSQRTGDPKYQEKVEKAIVALNKTFPADGLVPIYVNPNDGTAYGTITFGAMGDSFYEYLLKAWIQGNKTSSVKPYRFFVPTLPHRIRPPFAHYRAL